MTGIKLIATERLEQVTKHGYDQRHDAEYGNEELVQAALYCLEPGFFNWPRHWETRSKLKIDRKTRVQQLSVAGAFCAAEIDRLLINENIEPVGYIQGLNGKNIPIANIGKNNGLKRDIVSLVLNTANPDDDCMLSDFLQGLQFILNKHGI